MSGWKGRLLGVAHHLIEAARPRLVCPANGRADNAGDRAEVARRDGGWMIWLRRAGFLFHLGIARAHVARHFASRGSHIRGGGGGVGRCHISHCLCRDVRNEGD